MVDPQSGKKIKKHTHRFKEEKNQTKCDIRKRRGKELNAT